MTGIVHFTSGTTFWGPVRSLARDLHPRHGRSGKNGGSGFDLRRGHSHGGGKGRLAERVQNPGVALVHILDRFKTFFGSAAANWPKYYPASMARPMMARLATSTMGLRL